MCRVGQCSICCTSPCTGTIAASGPAPYLPRLARAKRGTGVPQDAPPSLRRLRIYIQEHSRSSKRSALRLHWRDCFKEDSDDYYDANEGVQK